MHTKQFIVKLLCQQEGEIPDVEWWDSVILRGDRYVNVIIDTWS